MFKKKQKNFFLQYKKGNFKNNDRKTDSPNTHNFVFDCFENNKGKKSLCNI